VLIIFVAALGMTKKMSRLTFQIRISEFQQKKINEYKDKGLTSNDIVTALSAPCFDGKMTIRVFCKKTGEYIDIDRGLFKSKKITFL
jgi:hypothetical protein